MILKNLTTLLIFYYPTKVTMQYLKDQNISTNGRVMYIYYTRLITDTKAILCVLLNNYTILLPQKC